MAGKIGTGARFRGLEGKLARRGARNPAALAAWIGRRRYGEHRFEELAEAGRKKAERERKHDKHASKERRRRV